MSIETVLIVDDEILMRKFLQESLRRIGIAAETAQDGLTALNMLGAMDFDVVFTDIKMPRIDGMELLQRIKGEFPETDVVVMTAYGTIENAVEAMKFNASDYIVKPFTVDQIEIILKRINERRSLIHENKYLKKELNDKYNFNEIIGKSRELRSTIKTIQQIASSKATVLIHGESGTGKELVARAVHYNSNRKDAPFIRINCAAMPENLIESELFGHEKGAFTSAHSKRLGRFELADHGTILLDEISEIPLNVQAKLLRVIQEREFERVGGEKSIKVDVRIIATSNRDLVQAVQNGEFREDLYYRLNVIPLYIPPLRERKDDCEELIHYFVEKYCHENAVDVFSVSDDSMAKLKEYSWPGNVRELENLVERSVVMGKKRLLLPSEMLGITQKTSPQEEASGKLTIMAGVTVRDMEKQLIFETLKRNCWNKTKTAQMLDISIRTLRNKLNEYRHNAEIPEEFSVLALN